MVVAFTPHIDIELFTFILAQPFAQRRDLIKPIQSYSLASKNKYLRFLQLFVTFRFRSYRSFFKKIKNLSRCSRCPVNQSLFLTSWSSSVTRTPENRASLFALLVANILTTRFVVSEDIFVIPSRNQPILFFPVHAPLCFRFFLAGADNRCGFSHADRVSW